MKKYTLIVTAILALFVLAACAPKAAEPAAATESAPAYALIAEGRLSPAASQDVFSPFSGVVEQVLVEDGDMVNVGQALVVVKTSPEMEFTLAKAEAEIVAAQAALDALKSSGLAALDAAEKAVTEAETKQQNAQNNVDVDPTEENQARLAAADSALEVANARLEILVQNGGIDPAALQAAESRVTAAASALTAAQNAATLSAPVDGVVSYLDLRVGQLLPAFTPVMSVFEPANWIIQTDNLTEIDVVNVQVGQKVLVNLDALPDLALDGTVTRVNSRYEEKRGDITYTVTIALDQSDPRMRWGMTGAVQFLP